MNRDWQQGIASSIRAAVTRLPGACDGVLILLADQPLVGSHSLNRLAAAWRRQPRSIVASRYGAVTGVPAIFPRWCFSDLGALRGDRVRACCYGATPITWCALHIRRLR